MEMVYPKDLLRYFELTGFREETVLEKDRFGVESGELILSTEGQEWDAINEENNKMAENKAAIKRGEDIDEYEPEVFENGDTRKQLLARSRYLLFKSRNKWTESQKKRAKILFELYPDIENAYNLTDELRRIYSSTKIKGVAYTKLAHWYKHVEDAGYVSFQVVKQTIYENYIDILNFFDNRSTNASAESFNAKIKNFRAQLRGISDVKYFLFRLQKIYA